MVVCNRRLNGEEIVGTVYVKESQKTNQSFELKKYKKNGDKLKLCGKGYDDLLNSHTHKKISLYTMSYYPQPDNHSKNKEYRVKIGAGVDISDFTKKVDLASLRYILTN